MIRPTARASLRALLLGAALLAGGAGGGAGPIAAEESCFAKSAMDRMPDWVQARGEFFRRYALSLRNLEHYRRLESDPERLATYGCGCSGEDVPWAEVRPLVPAAVWQGDYRVWGAEERRLRSLYAEFRTQKVIPTCSKH